MVGLSVISVYDELAVHLNEKKIGITNSALQYCSLICIICYNSSNAFYKKIEITSIFCVLR